MVFSSHPELPDPLGTLVAAQTQDFVRLIGHEDPEAHKHWYFPGGDRPLHPVALVPLLERDNVMPGEGPVHGLALARPVLALACLLGHSLSHLEFRVKDARRLLRNVLKLGEGRPLGEPEHVERLLHTQDDGAVTFGAEDVEGQALAGTAGTATAALGAPDDARARQTLEPVLHQVMVLMPRVGQTVEVTTACEAPRGVHVQVLLRLAQVHHELGVAVEDLEE
mmetsp:Transcript_1525/g.3348  ORF Transcript_1525/g.3348 Transcript_1525/m.3348 type:complete len:223 (+) Transcript_1525:111-779(+)